MLNFISIVIAGILFFNMNAIPIQKKAEIIKPEEKEQQIIITEGDFDEKMIKLINETDLKNENYMFSPLSFKYATSMLAAGVSGEAKNELLQALNYSSEEEMLKDINKITKDIEKLGEPLKDVLQYYDEDLETLIKTEKETYESLKKEIEDLKIKFKEETGIDLKEAQATYELEEKEYEKYEKYLDSLNKEKRNEITELENDISFKYYKLDDTYREILYLESILKPIQFDVANSIWYNETVGGNRKVKEEYKNKLSNYFNAEYFSKQGKDFSSSINKWVSDKTHEKITEIATPNNDYETILALINAIYMKADWETEFRDYNTKPDIFTTIDNKKLEKDFMFDTFGGIPYYEDKDTQIVGLTFKGQSTMYFVIGDTTNIEEKIKQCKPEREVHIYLPKFEIETTLSGEMMEVANKLGIKKIFKKDHETFKEMFTETDNIFISDIIQKTFLKVEERGIEAAAVTAIMTCGVTAIEEEYIPKLFKADKPFSFYIYTDDENNNPEHLTFFGQYVK